MNRPKLIGGLVPITAAALLVVACGDDGNDDSAALDRATPEPGPGAGTHLTVEAHDTEFDRDAYRTAAGPVDIEYIQEGELPHSLVVEAPDGGDLAGAAAYNGTLAVTLRFVGLRDRLVGLLSRGEAPELDPNELVVLETVQAPNGPMMVEALRNAGIEAVAVEAFDAVTARHAVQMKVPRRQVREATEVLDRLR